MYVRRDAGNSKCWVIPHEVLRKIWFTKSLSKDYIHTHAHAHIHTHTHTHTHTHIQTHTHTHTHRSTLLWQGQWYVGDGSATLHHDLWAVPILRQWPPGAVQKDQDCQIHHPTVGLVTLRRNVYLAGHLLRYIWNGNTSRTPAVPLKIGYLGYSRTFSAVPFQLVLYTNRDTSEGTRFHVHTHVHW